MSKKKKQQGQIALRCDHPDCKVRENWDPSQGRPKKEWFQDWLPTPQGQGGQRVTACQAHRATVQASIRELLASGVVGTITHYTGKQLGDLESFSPGNPQEAGRYQLPSLREHRRHQWCRRQQLAAVRELNRERQLLATREMLAQAPSARALRRGSYEVTSAISGQSFGSREQVEVRQKDENGNIRSFKAPAAYALVVQPRDLVKGGSRQVVLFCHRSELGELSARVRLALSEGLINPVTLYRKDKETGEITAETFSAENAQKFRFVPSVGLALLQQDWAEELEAEADPATTQRILAALTHRRTSASLGDAFTQAGITATQSS